MLERRRRLRALAAVRAAAVYRVADRVILCPQLLTRDGYQVTGPPTAFGWPVAPGTMVLALRGALAASGRIIRSPGREADIFKPVIEAAGVKSYKVFMARAILVDVTLDAGVLRLIAMRNHGPRRGFESSGDEAAGVFAADAIENAADRLLDLLEESKAKGG